jgi:hypothetical protein
MKMEATWSSKNAGRFSTNYTALHIPENRAFHNHRCENLRSHKTACISLKLNPFCRIPKQTLHERWGGGTLVAHELVALSSISPS